MIGWSSTIKKRISAMAQLFSLSSRIPLVQRVFPRDVHLNGCPVPGFRFFFKSAAEGVGGFRRPRQTIMSLPDEIDPIRRDIKASSIVCNFEMRFLRIERK